MNGKVSGVVSVGSTPVELNGIDLHAYIVVGDGRAYTAVSEVPETLGWALMPAAPIGGVFGWLFALRMPDSQNGFNITGENVTASFIRCPTLHPSGVIILHHVNPLTILSSVGGEIVLFLLT